MEFERQVRAFAPATVGNACVGFDILGFAIDGFGDHVRVRRRPSGVVIQEISGLPAHLPLEAERNTATLGLITLIEEKGLDFGFDVSIEKGIPVGSGLGGSASSAVAGIVAASALLDTPLTPAEMFRYAMVGERIASGTAHGDNVAPCLFGGLTLVNSLAPVDVIEVPLVPGLFVALVHPQRIIETRLAREILPETFGRHAVVRQSANLAGFLAGAYTQDLDRMLLSSSDVLVQPYRSQLLPEFDAAREAAEEAGARSFALSGSGPTVFAFCVSQSSAETVVSAVQSVFERQGIGTSSWCGPISKQGAHIVPLESACGSEA